MNDEKKPDVNVYINLNNRWHQIGVGWTNQNGSIRVVFMPLIQLPLGSEVSITLFPNKPRDPRE